MIISLCFEIKRFSSFSEEQREEIRNSSFYNQQMRVIIEKDLKERIYVPFSPSYEDLIKSYISLTDQSFLDLDDQAEKFETDFDFEKWAIGYWFDRKGNAFQFSLKTHDWELIV